VDRDKLISVYARGVRTSIRNNSTAYGYSVMITASLAALTALEKQPKLGELFLYVGGAAAGFAIVEATVSNFFRDRVRGEPSEVIILGSALSFLSISSGLGTAILVAKLSDSWLPWALGPFAATIVYLLIVGAEMTIAHRIEE
jgi:hypothetical protein